MKQAVLVLSCLVAGIFAFAESEWVALNISPDGFVRSVSRIVSAKDYSPDPARNEYPADYVFPDAPARYWKVDGTNVTEMTDAEKYQVDHGHKTAEQKAYENAFYELTEQILTATSDPRAGQTPAVKLGFPEIQAMIEAIQVADPMAAVNLSLKLLTVDAALKRFSLLWWDNAVQHAPIGD